MNFKKLITNNKDYVRNIIRLITKEDNEDLEQEVYIRAWKNSDKYEERGNFKSWICTVAKNISKDYLKSAYKKNEQNSTNDDNVISLIPDKKDTPEIISLNKFRQKRIIDAIESLKPQFKEIIIMYEMQGYSYEKISKNLDIPVGTVKSRLYNAKKILAELLKDLM